MRIVQISKTALVAMVAAFFSLVCFGNITDYDSNWQFVHHVLAMDTIFADSELRWRAVTSPGIQTAAYWVIIAWQGLTAVVLWLGVVRLLAARSPEAFRAARSPAVVGLTLGSLLYGFGFVVVGGEWFAMWQSEHWNGQNKALLFLFMILAVLIVLLTPDSDN